MGSPAASGSPRGWPGGGRNGAAPGQPLRASLSGGRVGAGRASPSSRGVRARASLSSCPGAGADPGNPLAGTEQAHPRVSTAVGPALSRTWASRRMCLPSRVREQVPDGVGTVPRAPAFVRETRGGRSPKDAGLTDTRGGGRFPLEITPRVGSFGELGFARRSGG